MSDLEILAAYLLAFFLDHGGSGRITVDELIEGAVRVAYNNAKIEIEEDPDGDIIMRLK